MLLHMGSTLLALSGLSLQSSFVFHRRNKKVIQVWNKWVSKWWQNLIFLLYYPFNSMNCVLRWNNESCLTIYWEVSKFEDQIELTRDDSEPITTYTSILIIRPNTFLFRWNPWTPCSCSKCLSAVASDNPRTFSLSDYCICLALTCAFKQPLSKSDDN